MEEGEDAIRKMVDDGAAVVGTPDDAVDQIRRLREKQGEFGVFLQLAHNWADIDKTRKSYELWRRHVSPVVNRMNDTRQDSFEWAAGHAEPFIKAARDAAASTIARHDATKEGARPG